MLLDPDKIREAAQYVVDNSRSQYGNTLVFVARSLVEKKLLPKKDAVLRLIDCLKSAKEKSSIWRCCSIGEFILLTSQFICSTILMIGEVGSIRVLSHVRKKSEFDMLQQEVEKQNKLFNKGRTEKVRGVWI